MELTNRQWRASTNYKIHEKLGEGAYSQVYRAQREVPELDLNQTVAIKILKSKNTVEMWRKEFNSLARVKSPYCIQVFAFEQSDDLPALVLEYVDGLNIKELIQYGTISQHHCSEIMAQIYQGLKDLKNVGLCHGDLSPKNVMIDKSGQVRLLDFGTANSKEDQAAITPGFAAPEIISGNSLPSFCSDLYSLGSLGCFMQRHSPSMGLTFKDLLATNPNERCFIFGEPNQVGKQALAKLISDVCKKKSELNRLSTKTFFTSVHSRAFKFASLKPLNFVAMILLFISISSSQTAFSLRHTMSGVLRIRTASWHLIEVDGQAIGYAPIDLNHLKPGTHLLKWKNALTQGSIKLDIQSGKSYLLTERELHSY